MRDSVYRLFFSSYRRILDVVEGLTQPTAILGVTLRKVFDSSLLYEGRGVLQMTRDVVHETRTLCLVEHFTPEVTHL